MRRSIDAIDSAGAAKGSRLFANLLWRLEKHAVVNLADFSH